jgi:hypothetical protein
VGVGSMARAFQSDHPDWVPDKLAPSRGIIYGLILSIPVWLLIIGGLLIVLGRYS